jgi:hypothetical protein
MFKNVQNTSHLSEISPKTLVFNTGMTLAKRKSMRTHITYKDITMMLGVLVALVIVFTMWVRTPSNNAEANIPAVKISLPKPPSTPAVIKGVVLEILR